MRVILMGLAVVAVATPAVAETWNSYSRSANNVFMADVDSIATNGDITSLKVATTPRNTEAGDYSHSIETYEFRCGSETWRTAGLVEHGPDGAEMERFPEDGAPWEPVRAGTMPALVEAIACDGIRAVPPTWPSIKAFIDAGRP
jgi:hypothetical protein